MHHVVDVLRRNREMAAFITPPASGTFGHINSFDITSRGIAGTAIELRIGTSAGVWTIRKELVIRSLFRNHEIGLTRLKSARFFLDIEKDRLGLIAKILIRGFGSGHGVGLQQTGAEGFARKGRSYRDILRHYFTNALIAVL